MSHLIRTLVDPVTYRRLTYLLLGMPLGLIWFVCLVSGWSVSLGLVVTPLVIPALLALAYMTHGFTLVEAELARSLLGVQVQAPSIAPAPGGGLRTRLRSLFGQGFWRAQAYLWTRWLLGFPTGTLMLALIGSSISMIAAPLWIPLVPRGGDLGFWHVHTFLQALVLVPGGLITLALSVALAGPLGGAFAALSTSMLGNGGEAPSGIAAHAPAGLAVAGRSRRALAIHGTVDGALVAVLVVIWAATSGGYFWPIWPALPLAAALAVQGWFVLLGERPQLLRRFRGSEPLAATAGVAAVLWSFTVSVWAVTGDGYFWPIWPLIGLGVLVGAIALAVLLGSAPAAELTERIETLTATRAGAVNVQDSELRRIERDLHDGAQARLVALGMSLGMAEQKLAEDPEQAAALLAEARAGAEHALRELRDLARGIHPPVLTDRGLRAAIEALANSTPMRIVLAVDVPRRPPAAVESAAYFVAAESLTNATKHARADWLEIRIAQVGRMLEVEIRDDGMGGADANGSGLVGLRQRVEALDGTLQVSSPPGGPTTVYAELPCGW